MSQRIRPFIFRFILLAGGLGLGIGAAELVLRVVGISYPLPYYPDRFCGSRLQSNWSGWFTKEGRALVRTNSIGFRDREHSLEKPANTFRVAVVGDSYVEAAQVASDDAFWSVLERELQDCQALEGRRVEVLSFGVAGWGTAQALQAFRHHIRPYSPDLVVLAFFPGNDLRNNSRALEPETVRPFYKLRDDELVLDDSFLHHPSFLRANSPWVQTKVAWINRSRLLQVLNEIRQRSRQPSASQANAGQLGLDDSVYLAPSNHDWEEAWAVTERLISRFHAESRDLGIEFCVATVTSGIQVHPDPQARRDYQRRLGVDRLDYAERRLEALGEREKFPVFVLVDRLAQEAEERGEYFHGFPNTRLGDGHWNASGHRAAGRLIAADICQYLASHRLRK